MAEPASGSSQTPEPSADARPPVSPFRRVLEGADGFVLEHQGRRLYSNESITFDLASGEVLIHCDYTRGYLLSGKNLYFAARMSPYSVCPDAPFLLEYAGKKWELRRYIDAHALLLDEWLKGTTIAAVVPYRGGPPFGYELVKVSGSGTLPRPQKGASDPHQPDTHCYTELQEPYSLHAFLSGAIMVVGQSRCDISGDPDAEELSDEERALRYRPLVESFPKGSQRSTLFSLPFDEIVWVVETDSEALLILGKIRSSEGEDAPGKMVLVSFDGKSVQKLDANVEGAQQIVLHSGTQKEAGDGVGGRTGDRASTESLWILGESFLRPAGSGEPLVLPPNCQPQGAWFEGRHAWLACLDGLYTTDPDQGTIEVPKTESFSTCEVLDPRPEYPVAGLFKKASPAGGCGRNAREFDILAPPQPEGPEADKKSGFY